MKQKICGIYKITSPSGKIYIGQSVDINNRWKIYKRLKCNGQILLYNSFLKYGVENHKFEIIEESVECELNDKEVYYIQLLDTFNTEHGLNLTSGGNSKIRYSQISKNKMAESKRGVKQSAEHIRNRTESSKGRVSPMKGRHHTQKTKDKISTKLTGYKRGKEEIEKTRIKNTGQKRTDETKYKQSQKKLEIRDSISAWVKERWANLPVEEKEKIKKNLSEKNTGKKQSQETINKRVAKNTGKKRTDEAKKKIGDGNRNKVRTEETKSKLRLAWIRRKEKYPATEAYKKNMSLIKKVYWENVRQARLTMT